MAESYLGEEGFYFPHNLDFRGRAYPMHPNLNHLGADLSRGLLQFAEAKPLGPDGVRWLEISVCCHAMVPYSAFLDMAWHKGHESLVHAQF